LVCEHSADRAYYVEADSIKGAGKTVKAFGTGSANNQGAAIGTQETANQDPASQAGLWRQSKLLIVVELIAVALIFVADARKLVPISKTPFLLAFGWISLLLRKLRWRDVGLSRYKSWGVTLGSGVGAGLMLEAFQLFVSQPLLVRVLGKQPDLEVFRALHGSLKWTLIALVGAWTLAALGEEMVYRGYLMNRVADLMNRTTSRLDRQLGGGPRGIWVGPCVPRSDRRH
jgi:hypothetical protein